MPSDIKLDLGIPYNDEAGKADITSSSSASSTAVTRIGEVEDHSRQQDGERSRDNQQSTGPERASEEEVSETEEWYQLGFRIACSLRYHSKRRAFFEHCNQLTRALSAIAGLGTVGAIVSNHHTVTIGLGLLIGLASTLDLVIDFSKRAMTYDDLYRRFADLSVETASANQTEANYRRLMVKRLLIEKEEPTSLSVLNVMCSNEELEARGFDYTHRVKWLQRAFSNFMDFGKQHFAKIDRA